MGQYLPLRTQASHADPFKERLEALLIVLCVFLGGLDEVPDVGDVHVRVASHACCHIFYRIRLGVVHKRGRRRTCDTIAFVDQKE